MDVMRSEVCPMKQYPETIENRWDVLYRDYPEIYNTFASFSYQPSILQVVRERFDVVGNRRFLCRGMRPRSLASSRRQPCVRWQSSLLGTTAWRTSPSLQVLQRRSRCRMARWTWSWQLPLHSRWRRRSGWSVGQGYSCR